MQTISVIPVGGGWAVQLADGDVRMFLSGGRAETKAKQLAKLSQKLGDSAEVLIHDRNGRLIGRKTYAPAKLKAGSSAHDPAVAIAH